MEAASDDRGSVAAASTPVRTLLYGSLVDPDAKPLDGLGSAGVSVTDASGRRRYCDAKNHGAFSFYSLPFGKYWISASADGFRRVEDRVELSADRPEVQKVIVLKPATILKIVVTTPDGQNFFDQLKEQDLKHFLVLLPVATATAPGPWFKEVVGSLNNPFGIGHFWEVGSGPRVDKLPRGCMGIVILDRDPPAYVSLLHYQRVLQTREVKPGDEEVQFVLSPDEFLASFATIKMQVVDAETQSPLADARAMLSGGTYMNAGVKADENGAITIEGREPGEFDLRLFAKEHEQYNKHFLADAGVPTDLGKIPLEREVQANVQILDESGHPAAARFVMGVIDESTGELRTVQHQIYEAKGDGVLKLFELGRHVYVLRTANLDAVNDREEVGVKLVSGNVKMDLRAGGDSRGFEIRLHPATSATILVQGRNPDGMRFRVTDEQGFDLVSSRFYGSGPRPLSLPPGTYRVALLDAEEHVVKESAISVAASPVAVTFSP